MNINRVAITQQIGALARAYLIFNKVRYEMSGYDLTIRYVDTTKVLYMVCELPSKHISYSNIRVFRRGSSGSFDPIRPLTKAEIKAFKWFYTP